MAQEPARSRALGLIPEDILTHVPGFTAGSTAWAARLSGGRLHASYRVETSAGRFVVRMHDPAATTLGADHEREEILHAVAAAAGLAPALVYVDEGHRFMIMEHVSGSTWTAEDFARPERLVQLGAALHALHSVPPPAVAPFDVELLLIRHHERLSAALPGERAQLDALMDRARVALRVSETTQRAKTVVHNDLHHSNLIGSDRLYLLDWEYAAVADPLLDLACVLAYYPAASAHADQLLDATRLSALASTDMLAATTWLFMFLSYVWYRARRLNGAVSEADLAAEQGLLDRLS
jgi:thiamine kinase